MNSPSSAPFARRLPGLAAALALALVLAAVAVTAPAQAAFPGVPGPIAYSKRVSSEVGADSGGLFAHGPRKRQKTRRLTSGLGDTSPSYSADGRTVVFAGNREPGESDDSHIYLVNASGSGVRALTSGDNYDSNPSFSPDGEQVVFDRAVGSARTPHIFVVDVDDGSVRQLTRGSSRDYDPVYAPNGNWIAFVSNRDKDARSDQSDIFSMRPSGARVRVLVDGPYSESEPDISPDGRRIAFVSNRQYGPNIYVARSTGRDVRALTHTKHGCTTSVCYLNPAWAPDGKHIAFISRGRYSTDLEVMRSDGTQRKEFAGGGTEVEGFGTTIGAPAWGPRPR